MKMIKLKNFQIFFINNFVWFLVVGVFVVLGLVKISFLSNRVILYILYVSSLTGLLIFGQGICLITGNFDLSIARIAGISVLLGALIFTRWFPGIPGILIVIFVVVFGALLGAINGILVGKVGVNSFLATLSTHLVYLYLGYYLLAAPIVGRHLPSSFMWLGGAEIGGIHVSFIVFVIIGLFLNFILKKTSFGVSLYATGANAETARALGINTGNVILYTYIIAGALGGVAGLAYAGFTGCVTNSLALGEVFWTFAGAVIGGISLKGGRGSMINVIGGSIFIGLITTGVLVFNVIATLRMVIAGVMILLSILISKAIEKWEEKIL